MYVMAQVFRVLPAVHFLSEIFAGTHHPEKKEAESCSQVAPECIITKENISSINEV